MKLKTIDKKKFNPKMSWKKDFKKNWSMYLIFIPVFVFFLIFNYIPMGGLLMAFEDYKIKKGIFGSDWVWFDNFAKLFADEQAKFAFRNTMCMALLNLTIGFIFPVFFALLISQVKIKPIKRIFQSISYMPNFVATVVICTLLQQFLDVRGAITQLFVAVFGMKPQNILAINSPVFWFINCFADLWQGCGYAAIVFVAAISNVNTDLYEAASIDGAGRLRRIFSITLPCIWPTIITMFTLKVGLVFKTGFDKILLLEMATTWEHADVLTSFIYRTAFATSMDYGLSTALGLFQSLISMILLILSNKLNKIVTKTSLFEGGQV